MKIENDSVLVSGIRIINCGWENDSLYYEYAIVVKGRNCTISNNTFENDKHGIFLGGVSATIIENNNFVNCTAGIWSAYSKNISISHNSFQASIVTEKTKYGIRFGGSKGPYYYSIENNSFTDGLNFGVYSSGNNVNNISFKNNTFENIEIGVYLQSVDDCVFDYCDGYNNNVTLIIVSSKNVTVTNSRFVGNYWAIKLASVNDFAMKSCLITSNYGGILVDYINSNSSSCSLRRCEISENLKYGIEVFRFNGIEVDARNNYWGNDLGPNHPKFNSQSEGDNITDHILFEPWLESNFDNLKWLRGKDKDNDNLKPMWIGSGIATLSIFGLLGTAFFREDLRFLLLSLLSAPLYTKLEKSDILNQPKRQDIYSYIVNKPGTNLTRLHNELPIGYGTLVHHLKVLEREKHVRSKKEMGRKLFFPTGTDWLAVKQEREKSRDVSGTPPSDVEGGGLENRGRTNGAGGRPDPLGNLSSVPVGIVIMKFLKTNGPATQSEIAKKLILQQTTVSYNLRKLEEEGKVKGSGEKRGAVYSLNG